MIPKFRAFCKGHMFEVIEMVWRNGKIKYIRGILSNGGLIGGHADYMDITKIKLMQFTNLHDKNEKEIYEGDITKVVGQNLRSISCYQEFQPKIGDMFFVVRLKSGFNLCPIKSYGKLSKIDDELICNIHTYINNYKFWNGAKSVEVIGNIHENPELMEDHNGDNT